MRLRSYQEACIDDCMAWIKKSTAPCVVDATVSFGKSVVIAALAKRIEMASGKGVLILCPSGTLAAQNSGKLSAMGIQHSIFSASLKQKSLRHKIVIATPLTVSNRISAFDGRFSAVLIDEGDLLTKSVREIVEQIRSHNPLMRTIGFTGTPYRMRTGYVYREDLDGNIMGEDLSIDPFYAKLVHRTSTRDLMEMGYLTPAVVGQINASGYDTTALKANARGQFKSSDVDQAYHGHGRKTSAIVADIVAQAADRHGVLIFGATIQHCHEIMASLPPQISRMVASGEKDNARNINDFRAGRFKYLVNKDMLTVGADFPHVDMLALLRKTESARLLTQIIGRGLRLHEANPEPHQNTPEARKAAIAAGPKPSVLILDYTTNMEDHCPDGDLFAPVVRAGKGGGEGGGLSCTCPICAYENSFTVNPQYLGVETDAAGYALDLDGRQMMSDFGPIPAHFGRRCMGIVQSGARGEYERCSYRWTFKPCPHCEAENDIAARYCKECRGEIVDPNDKLKADFKAFKKDPTQWQTDKVISMTCKPGMSAKGNPTIRVEWVTPYRQFSTWFSPDSKSYSIKARHEVFVKATDDGSTPPATITYRKDPATQFFEIRAYNREADHAPD